MPETKVVAGVIYTNESGSYILTLHNSDGFYLPFDVQRTSETTEDAVKRIVVEGLGLQFVKSDAVGWRDEINTKNASHYVTLLFLIEIDGEIDINDEKSTFDWIPIEKAETMNLQFDHQELVKLMNTEE
jgi:ADP-ribose pyrophosphatase YjhB (NUDIX family)